MRAEKDKGVFVWKCYPSGEQWGGLNEDEVMSVLRILRETLSILVSCVKLEFR